VFSKEEHRTVTTEFHLKAHLDQPHPIARCVLMAANRSCPRGRERAAQ
jgi:hypothetical protein